MSEPTEVKIDYLDLEGFSTEVLKFGKDLGLEAEDEKMDMDSTITACKLAIEAISTENSYKTELEIAATNESDNIRIIKETFEETEAELVNQAKTK